MDPGDRLDQSRLAGAVVADQADHLTGVDLEVDPVQSLDRAESLAYAFDSEQSAVRGHRRRSPLGDPQFLAGGGVGAGAEFVRGMNSSLITVSLTLSLVTATGSSSTEGTLVLPLLISSVILARSGFFAFGQRDGDFRGGLGLEVGRLVDGHVLLAGDDPLHAGDRRVLAGAGLFGRVDAGDFIAAIEPAAISSLAP